jgi:hypothetical protein
MNLALADLCVSFVFILVAILFAVSVAVVMTVEGLKHLHQRSSAAVATIGRSLASVAKPASVFCDEEELGGPLSTNEQTQWKLQD